MLWTSCPQRPALALRPLACATFPIAFSRAAPARRRPGLGDAGARRHGRQVIAHSSAEKRTMSEANLVLGSFSAGGRPVPDAACADVSLVAAIHDGGAFRDELYVRYRRPLLQVFLQRRVQRDVAEDLLQRTFLQAIQKIRKEGLEDPSKLGGYLYRTA